MSYDLVAECQVEGPVCHDMVNTHTYCVFFQPSSVLTQSASGHGDQTRTHTLHAQLMEQEIGDWCNH